MSTPPRAKFASTRRLDPRHCGGFTLIELVLVMLLLCIILGMAVPQLRGFMSGSAARDSATQVIALAQYARAKAAADSVNYRLTFDPQNGEYWLSAGSADGTGEFTRLSNDFGQTFKLPEGMKVSLEQVPTGTTSRGVTNARSTGSSNDIEFHPDGTSDAVLIRLTESFNNVETLIAAPAPTEPFRITTAQEMNDQ
jgi:prepilin-type N-terminal cleavage/methylation domain-containing protein